MIRPELLLRVETDYFVAGAVYQKIGGAWSCVHAAPILHWLKGMNPDHAKLALLRMNAQYEFLPQCHGAPQVGVSRQLANPS